AKHTNDDNDDEEVDSELGELEQDSQNTEMDIDETEILESLDMSAK
ncbi:unnamed protein product, partial [Rotaria magnacalcarata]